jgi:hypothetical protein
MFRKGIALKSSCVFSGLVAQKTLLNTYCTCAGARETVPGHVSECLAVGEACLREALPRPFVEHAPYSSRLFTCAMKWPRVFG